MKEISKEVRAYVLGEPLDPDLTTVIVMWQGELYEAKRSKKQWSKDE